MGRRVINQIKHNFSLILLASTPRIILNTVMVVKFLVVRFVYLNLDQHTGVMSSQQHQYMNAVYQEN